MVKHLVLFFALISVACSSPNSPSTPAPLGWCNLYEKPLKITTWPSGSPDTITVCEIDSISQCDCMKIDSEFTYAVIPSWAAGAGIGQGIR